MRRATAWLCVAGLLAHPSTPDASPHDEGLAAGRAAVPVARAAVSAASAAAHVPGYGTSAPQSAYYGRPNLSSVGNAALAACVATPADPVCQAQLGAARSANTAREPVRFDDPSVAAARGIGRNPSAVLGGLADFYAGCSAETTFIPATTAVRTCQRRIGLGEFSLLRTLSVDVERVRNCAEGTWFASTIVDRNALDSMKVEVQCQTRADGLIRFRLAAAGQQGACIGPQIVELPVEPSTRPTAVTDLSPHWEHSCWSPFKVVLQPGSGCQGSQCAYRFEFGRPSFACPAGSTPSDSIPTTWDDHGPTYGEPGRCLSVGERRIEPGCPSGAITVFPEGIARCAVDIGTAEVTGASGWVVPLSFARPGVDVRETDTWSGQEYLTGGRCTPASADRCTDGPSTKLIDGHPVTRACWSYESTLTCSGANLPGDCGLLVRDGCALGRSSCRQVDESTGQCQLYEDRYHCAVPEQVSTRTGNCPANVFCLGESCFDIASPPDGDFARSMSMLEAAREAGVYLDIDRLQVFKGEANFCRDRLLKNCCYADSAGKGMNNQSVFGNGSKLVYDMLMNSENQAFVTQGLAALLTSGGFSGTFSSYGVTLAVNGAALPAGSVVAYAGESMVIAFDPWSLVIAVVIYIIMSMMSCNEEEGRLAMKEGAGLCHAIGEWCSSRTLGSCSERTTGKCCFNSVLARIINEQGRTQVGRGWGSPQVPDCSGFSVDQLQSLNFAAMDLSEFYASLIPTLPGAGGLQAQGAARLPACYFGQGRCQ